MRPTIAERSVHGHSPKAGRFQGSCSSGPRGEGTDCPAPTGGSGPPCSRPASLHDHCSQPLWYLRVGWTVHQVLIQSVVFDYVKPNIKTIHLKFLCWFAFILTWNWFKCINYIVTGMTKWESLWWWSWNQRRLALGRSCCGRETQL